MKGEMAARKAAAIPVLFPLVAVPIAYMIMIVSTPSNREGKRIETSENPNIRIQPMSNM
jgi:hypothetical protein